MSNTAAPSDKSPQIASAACWPHGQPLTEEAVKSAQQHAVLSIQRFIASHRLPGTYGDVFTGLAIPLAAWLIRAQRSLGRPLMMSMGGAQGTGKTTLAQALILVLERCFAVSGCVLSLDDFYLSHRERTDLGRGLHPLLATRGVPGTHDVALLARTLTYLRTAEAKDLTRLPRFDKHRDDQAPKEQQRLISGQPRIIILEGWCLGAQPQPEQALHKAINELEQQQDPGGRWRNYVNDQLAGPYQDLMAPMDYHLHLAAPSWEAVLRWRWQQEQALIRSEGTAYQGGLDSPPAFADFMAHYERLTRSLLAGQDNQADILLQLNEQQCLSNLVLKPAITPIAPPTTSNKGS
ncbi:MAG: hypothetical protein EA349_12895 [Halomonadaceae bacterium]|nr:MAG: hypothetical protein EA349_12895 [Halomonadaceae bacterium]